jgi:antitoxin HigA-1
MITGNHPMHRSDDIDNSLLPNPHPGILLKEDFLDEMGIIQYRLAKATGLTQTHVSEVLKGKRSITPTTALLLGKFLETSPEYWVNLQTRYEMMEAKRSIGDRLAKVQPYQVADEG